MADSVRVAGLHELPPGSAKSVQVSGKTVALYNLGGTVFATDNACPHRGGSLGEGTLQAEIITCPWHGFQYDVTTGRCLTNPALSVPCRKVSLEGDSILVEV